MYKIPQEFDHQFSRERRLLSLGFSLMALLLIGVSLLQQPGGFINIAAEAYEQPVKVMSAVIRGVAIR